MRDGNYLYFALYIGLSVALGLIAVVVGNACAKMI